MLDPERAAKVRTAVHEELQLFARELVSSLQFYQGQPGSLGIAEVVLTGGTRQLPGLDAELGRMLGVQVRVGDPLSRVTLGKKLERHRGRLAGGCDRTGDGSMRAVNLLPKGRRAAAWPGFRSDPLVIGGVVGAVLVTAILAAMFLTASTGVADNQKRHDAVRWPSSPQRLFPPPAVAGASALEQEKSARIGALVGCAFGSARLGPRPP